MKHLRELAEAATPGPWRADGSCITGDGFYRDEYISTAPCMRFAKDSEPDAAYIAACSPEHIIALCDVVDAARERVAEACYYDSPSDPTRDYCTIQCSHRWVCVALSRLGDEQ